MSNPTDEDTLADLVKMGLIEVSDDEAPATAEAEKPVVAEAEKVEAPQAEADELFPGFNGLPEDVRKAAQERIEAVKQSRIDDYEAQLRQERQSRHAIEGKVGPTQRQLAEAQRRLAELESSQVQSRKTGSQEKFDQFKEQYPDEAEILGGMRSDFETELEKRDRENAELRASVQEMRERAHREDALNQLKQAHPDYAEIDRSEELAEWAQHISPLKRAWLSSADVSQVAEVLTDFKRDQALARFYYGQQSAQSEAPAKPLTKLRADPNPVTRKTTGVSRLGTAGTSDEEDQYSNAIEQARALGIDI